LLDLPTKVCAPTGQFSLDFVRWQELPIRLSVLPLLGFDVLLELCNFFAKFLLL